jgi:hypothetical protein
MNNEMNATGELIKFPNRNVFAIYSKMTKKGIRYYFYSRMQMRYFPISKDEINKYILLED